MTYQKLVIPVDHGNQNIKGENVVFTSGLVESDCKPMLGDYLYYKNRYYSLTDQRIPYMRDKTKDERFFILTLFAIAMEAERQGGISEDTKDEDKEFHSIGNTRILCTYGGKQSKRSLVLCKSNNSETSHDKRKTDKQWLL
ncbi:MAG: hypothetical protein J6C22_02775 [Bacteroides sp.]|nr:hypothetical protein [Bacteroides sp.]